MNPTQLEPGTVIFFHGTHWQDRCIQLAQRIRYPRGDAWRFNHTAIMVSPTVFVEATPHHVRTSRVQDISIEHVFVPITCSDEDRAQAVRYALAQVGKRYGWTDIPSIGLQLLTGWRLSVMADGTLICSQLAAEALEHAGYQLPREPQDMSPAGLYLYLTEGQQSSP